jgi:hypothetical protein
MSGHKSNKKSSPGKKNEVSVADVIDKDDPNAEEAVKVDKAVDPFSSDTKEMSSEGSQASESEAETTAKKAKDGEKKSSKNKEKPEVKKKTQGKTDDKSKAAKKSHQKYIFKPATKLASFVPPAKETSAFDTSQFKYGPLLKAIKSYGSRDSRQLSIIAGLPINTTRFGMIQHCTKHADIVYLPDSDTFSVPPKPKAEKPKPVPKPAAEEEESEDGGSVEEGEESEGEVEEEESPSEEEKPAEQRSPPAKVEKQSKNKKEKDDKEKKEEKKEKSPSRVRDKGEKSEKEVDKVSPDKKRKRDSNEAETVEAPKSSKKSKSALRIDELEMPLKDMKVASEEGERAQVAKGKESKSQSSDINPILHGSRARRSLKGVKEEAWSYLHGWLTDNMEVIDSVTQGFLAQYVRGDNIVPDTVEMQKAVHTEYLDLLTSSKLLMSMETLNEMRNYSLLNAAEYKEAKDFRDALALQV